MRGRPGLVTSYDEDTGVFRSGVQRLWFGVLLVVVILFGFNLPQDLVLLGATAMLAAVGAIGLNIVTGYAGQVSLGHAFFLGLGAYAGAVLSGDPDARVLGYGLDMLIWLPAAGLIAAAAGALVAPIATRLRGLYLAFVTLGLVFIGDHYFRELEDITGGVGVGRKAAVGNLLGFRFDQDGSVFGVFLTSQQKYYFLAFGVLAVLGLAAKNLARSRVGRAFAAVRDRDIAAEVMGIPLARYKLIAFTVSSFYAGIAGALLYSLTGFVEPSSFNLLLSIEYIAMILIGGVATIAGSIMGATFIVFLPRIVEALAGLPGLDRFITDAPVGGFLTTAQTEQILFGLLIIGFLILEPLGLYGLWFRIRNYWKAWPFSY